jgi:hypothetical protein
MRVPDTIAIELEAAGDSRSTFRLRSGRESDRSASAASRRRYPRTDRATEQRPDRARDRRCGGRTRTARPNVPRRDADDGVAGPIGRNECDLAPIGEKSISQADAPRVVACGNRWLASIGRAHPPSGSLVQPSRLAHLMQATWLTPWLAA